MYLALKLIKTIFEKLLNDNMLNTSTIDSLRNYIEQNEVVFQVCGELIEVSNETEKVNKQVLLSYFDDVSGIECFEQGNLTIKDEYAELNRWATKDDVLLLLQKTGVLICIPKFLSIENSLIKA